MSLPPRPIHHSCNPWDCFWFGRATAFARAELDIAKSLPSGPLKGPHLAAARVWGKQAREVYARATRNASFWPAKAQAAS